MYRDPLWEQSLQDVPEMQKKTKMLSFFKMISSFGKGRILLVIYAVLFNVMSVPGALYFACAISFTNFSMNQLKSLYSQPRPYWISNNITSFGKCHTGFGNPSGHMTNNVFLWYTVFLHFYDEIGIKRRRMSVFCTAYIIKIAVTAIVITYIIFMAFSRVYLGAHSYNQVLFGITLGVVFASVGHY
jgi:membrane-associated phospholipid phosphatase